jgi:hypothetical protein
MTDSKNYNVAGATVHTTVAVYVNKIDVHITVDLSALDKDEPDHSPHQIINYMVLPRYRTRDSYWWCKLHRTVTVKTGSQARRVIKNALVKIEDAVTQAVIDRDARKKHGQIALP